MIFSYELQRKTCNFLSKKLLFEKDQSQTELEAYERVANVSALPPNCKAYQIKQIMGIFCENAN